MLWINNALNNDNWNRQPEKHATLHTHSVNNQQPLPKQEIQLLSKLTHMTAMHWPLCTNYDSYWIEIVRNTITKYKHFIMFNLNLCVCSSVNWEWRWPISCAVTIISHFVSIWKICSICSLCTPRKPHSPSIVNGMRGFLRVNRL